MAEKAQKFENNRSKFNPEVWKSMEFYIIQTYVESRTCR